MSQQDLAKAIGTKQPAIARIESGKSNPRLSTLVELAEALGATVRVDFQPVEAGIRRPVAWWERRHPRELMVSVNLEIRVEAYIAMLPPPAVSKISAAPEVGSRTLQRFLSPKQRVENDYEETALLPR